MTHFDRGLDGNKQDDVELARWMHRRQLDSIMLPAEIHLCRLGQPALL